MLIQVATKPYPDPLHIPITYLPRIHFNIIPIFTIRSPKDLI